MQRPNFIVFMTDQHRADHLGCYGNEVVRTPNIDGIAARGRRFRNFFVATPICMPNRIAMMTGRMPSVNGSRHNGIPMDLDAVSYVDLLRAGGYRTALIGKSHLQDVAGRPVPESTFSPPPDLAPPPPELRDASRQRRTDARYEQELNPLWARDPDRSVSLPYYGFNHVRFANGHGDQVHGHYDRWLGERTEDPAALRGAANALPSPGFSAPQAWRTAVPEDLYPTSYIAEETVSYVEDHAQTGGDAPFFLQCSFPDPHHPFTPPGRYFDMYDSDTIELPRSFGKTGSDEHPFLTEMRIRTHLGDADAGGPRPFVLNDPDAARQIIALTYGMITMVDDAIGRVLESLGRTGLAGNTVVLFLSDHGDFMGDHGLMLKHGLHYDGVLRTPFIWCDPTEDGPVVDDRMASSIDVGTTILARAGLAPANGMQGMDLISRTSLDRLEERRGILVEEDELGVHLGLQDGMRTRTFLSGPWRLTLYDGIEHGELFDRETDPDELVNLWNSDAHRRTRSDLIELMLREMIRLSDTAPMSRHVA